MDLFGDDIQLLQGALHGDFDSVKAALRRGASVHGSPEYPFTPIMMAAFGEHPGILNFLFEQGADPDKLVTGALPNPECTLDTAASAIAMCGERAMHAAAWNGNVWIIRMLLVRMQFNPNTRNDRGRTPLMAACLSPEVCVKAVRVLLKAGADPTLADKDGLTPLHIAARSGSMDVVNILCTKAPTLLNRCGATGQTALFMACGGGYEGIASKLLSLGAVQPTPPVGKTNYNCPLTGAVIKDRVGIVRILANQRGIRAVGGKVALAQALFNAVRFDRGTILHLLLAVDGRGRRSEVANTSFGGWSLLHYGAGYGNISAVSILLEAGADETARDFQGVIPVEVIGLALHQEDIKIDPATEVAIRRMLERDPADLHQENVQMGQATEVANHRMLERDPADLHQENVQMGQATEVAIRRMLQRGPAYLARSFGRDHLIKMWMPVVAVIVALLWLLVYAKLPAEGKQQ